LKLFNLVEMRARSMSDSAAAGASASAATGARREETLPSLQLHADDDEPGRQSTHPTANPVDASRRSFHHF
jgi:hypothetical protein